VGIVAFEFPQWVSLGLIVVIFALAFLWAQQVERKRLTKTERAAQELYDGDVK
jgi:type VI protein secretion system component VasF